MLRLMELSASSATAPVTGAHFAGCLTNVAALCLQSEVSSGPKHNPRWSCSALTGVKVVVCTYVCKPAVVTDVIQPACTPVLGQEGERVLLKSEHEL